MTTEQALDLIDQALAQVNAPRQIHIQLQEALKIIQNAIKAKEPANG